MYISQQLRAELALVLVTLIAALGWIFSKEALEGAPPWLFVGIRFLLAGVVLLIAGYRHWSLLSSAANIIRCGKLGLVMSVAMLFWILGLYHGTHLGEGAFITSLGAVMVPLVGRLFFGERPPLSTWSALPLAVAGLACLSLEGGFQFEIGQIYFLGAALLFAVHFFVGFSCSRVFACNDADGYPADCGGSCLINCVLVYGGLAKLY